MSLEEIDDVFLKDFENLVCTFGIHVDIEIPVCLSGSTSHRYKGRDYNIIILVLPQKTGTVVTVSYNKKIKNLKNRFLFLNDYPISTLKFIEEIMIKNTDQWYIKPSVWSEIKLEKQKKS